MNNAQFVSLVEQFSPLLVWKPALRLETKNKTCHVVPAHGTTGLQFKAWLEATEAVNTEADAVSEFLQEGIRVHGMGVGIDQDERDTIEVYVESEANDADVRNKIAKILSVDRPLVDVVRTQGFRSEVNVGDSGRHQALPVHSYGTMGGYVQDTKWLYVLSNNHVLARNNAANVNDDLISPLPATVFGGLEQFVPLVLPPAVNEVDAALGWIHADQPTNSNYPAPPGTAHARRRMRVEKTGARTGHTVGRVTSVYSTAQIHYTGLGLLNFRRLIRVQGSGGPFTREGDSGSFVRSRESNRLVGLHMAGDGVATSLACKIQSVFANLSVEISHGG